MRTRLTLLGATFALAVAAVAHALPSDPPIVALTPADGATVPADPDGIRVTFACPAYTIAVYERGTDFGDVDNYGVLFSDRSTLATDGRLSTSSYSGNTGVSAAGVGGPETCAAKLDTVDTASSPEIVGGRVFWQAHRYCAGCPGQFETGPVRSFVVRPRVRGSLALPARIYAGYPGDFRFTSTAPLSGATVLLQRRGRSSWLTVAQAPFREQTRLIATLPAGRSRLRVRIRTATTHVDLPERTASTRRSRSRSTFASDDGDYRARNPAADSTLRFRVTGGGTMLRDFRASLRTSCAGTPPSQNRVVLANAVIRSARVAPDGYVMGFATTSRGERILLDGFLRDGGYRGSVEVQSASCSGARRVDAVRR